MRINKYIAHATGISRRAADGYLQAARVTLNGQTAKLGDNVEAGDKVTLDDRPLSAKVETVTILFNKPVGFVCSRDGQGSRTIYELLPSSLHALKPVGRLDKDSSGLLLLTNDGELANQLTHPRYQKQKIYQVNLNKPLEHADRVAIEAGVQLEDGSSSLKLRSTSPTRTAWEVTMEEGRNRQIRRSFEALGYKVISLHRTEFGDYKLGNLKPRAHKQIS